MSDWEPPEREKNWRLKGWRRGWERRMSDPVYAFLHEGGSAFSTGKRYQGRPSINGYGNMRCWIEGERSAFLDPRLPKPPKPDLLRLTPEQSSLQGFIQRLRSAAAGTK